MQKLQQPHQCVDNSDVVYHNDIHDDHNVYHNCLALDGTVDRS